tara:strand:+ start:105 stop:209 length:105 start_codon:yes stop_codon:yes gene_type:complete
MYEDQERILFQTGKQKTSGEKWEKVDVGCRWYEK